MAQSATNDPLSLVLTVGNYGVTGLAGGSPYRWANTVRRYEMAVGIRGLGAFTKVIDKSGTLSVDLMQESDDNGVLDAFRLLDENTDGGAGVSVELTDITGTDQLSCLICHIDGPPDISKGSPGDIYTWNFIGVEWSVKLGGRGPTPTVTVGDLPDRADIPSFGQIAI